jgi:hypothetical protein
MFGSSGSVVVSENYPEEEAEAGGPARCKEIDKEALTFYERQGGRPSMNLGLLEADWVATDKALYYVNYRVNFLRRIQWDSITSVKVSSNFGASRKLTIVSRGGKSQKWGVGRLASEDLLASYNRHRR